MQHHLSIQQSASITILNFIITFWTAPAVTVAVPVAVPTSQRNNNCSECTKQNKGIDSINEVIDNDTLLGLETSYLSTQAEIEANSFDELKLLRLKTRSPSAASWH